MNIELIRRDENNCDKHDGFESFREAYTTLINQVIDDKLYETGNVTVLRFKERGEIVREVQFSPSYSWERLMTQVEELPKLCETVLSTLNAALVFHESFFKKAEVYKTPYMCMALTRAAASEIITSEGSELTKSYIKLALNKLAEDTGWVFLTTETDEGIFQWEEEDKYVKEDCEDIDKEDLALNLILDGEWDDELTEEEQIKSWWVALISGLEENILPSTISMNLRP